MAKEISGNENLHEHHRKRMKENFVKNGLDSFEDHQVLEMMLFYSVPRLDTNETAHLLLNEFGSFSNVLEADIPALEEVPGVGHESALMFKFMSSVIRRYEIDRQKEREVIKSKNDAADFLRPYFLGINEEMFIVVLLNACDHIRRVCTVSQGDESSVFVNVNRVMREVINNHASKIILVHSHPNGFPCPSYEDFEITNMLFDKLKTLNVGICDHIIFASDEVYFMSDDTKMNKIKFVEYGLPED